MKTTLALSLTILLRLAAPTIVEAQSTAPPAPADYVIGVQDVLSISLFDQPELGGKFTVELSGTFTFPLVGRVAAGGLTIEQFETLLHDKLVDGNFFRNPQITVGVDQYRSQRVFVVGEVRIPGTYPLTRETTLIELLARAGSTTPDAGDDVVVVRGQGANANGPTLPPPDARDAGVVRIDLGALQSGAIARNIDLHDGDTVFVAHADRAYVFGEVKNPGAYPIRTGTTVLQTLSLAGGLTPSAATGRVKVIRFVNGEKKELNVKLDDIVRPGDTVTVPERYF